MWAMTHMPAGRREAELLAEAERRLFAHKTVNCRNKTQPTPSALLPRPRSLFTLFEGRTPVPHIIMSLLLAGAALVLILAIIVVAIVILAHGLGDGGKERRGFAGIHSIVEEAEVLRAALETALTGEEYLENVPR